MPDDDASADVYGHAIQAKDIERDFYLSAGQAKEYGLIDEVLFETEEVRRILLAHAARWPDANETKTTTVTVVKVAPVYPVKAQKAP